jgi:hypothetical protein
MISVGDTDRLMRGCSPAGGAEYAQEGHPDMIGIVQQIRAVPFTQDSAPVASEASDTAAAVATAIDSGAALAHLTAARG